MLKVEECRGRLLDPTDKHNIPHYTFQNLLWGEVFEEALQTLHFPVIQAKFHRLCKNSINPLFFVESCGKIISPMQSDCPEVALKGLIFYIPPTFF